MLPGVIGVEGGHGRRFAGLIAQIFLIDHSFLIDDECVDTCRTVPGRIGHQPETQNEFSVDQIIKSAANGR